MLILAWFLYWFIVWIILNFALFPKNITFIKGGIKSSIFFTLATLIPALIVLKHGSIYYLLLIFIQIILIYVLGKRYALERNLFSDIVFQQSMLYLLYLLSKQSFLISPLITFVACFSVSHIPVFLFKHVRRKLLIHLLLPLASSLMFISFYKYSPPLSLIISTVLHLSFYFILIKFSKGEAWGIVI